MDRLKTLLLTVTKSKQDIQVKQEQEHGATSDSSEFMVCQLPVTTYHSASKISIRPSFRAKLPARSSNPPPPSHLIVVYYCM